MAYSTVSPENSSILTFLNGSFPNETSSTSSVNPCGWPSAELMVTNPEQSPAMYFELVMYPILLFICTVGNGLNLVILFADRDKSTTNVYLICLAISDLFILWLQLPVILPEWDPHFLENPAFAASTINFYGLQKWISETCIQFSDWTLLVFSIERFLVISKPLQLRHLFRIRNAVIIQLVVLFLASIFAIENLIEHYTMLARDDGVTSMRDQIGPALVKWSAIQNQAEVGITLAKWIILVLINVVLIVVLTKHGQLQPYIFRSTQQDTTTINFRNSNGILLACICLYTISQLPNVILKSLMIASQAPHCSFNLTPEAYHIARPIVYIFLLTNYSLNFVLYCAVCRKFRRQIYTLSSSISCPTGQTSVNGSSQGTKNGLIPLEKSVNPYTASGKRFSNASTVSLWLHSQFSNKDKDKKNSAKSVTPPPEIAGTIPYGRKHVEEDLHNFLKPKVTSQSAQPENLVVQNSVSCEDEHTKL